MPNNLPRTVKYAWALLLSLSVAVVAVTEKDSPWQPLINSLIDALQLHMKAEPQPLPGAGQVPAGAGPLHLPAREKVPPAAAPSGAITPPDVAAAD